MSIVEEEDSVSITWIEINQDWEWYYFVPLLDRQEWDGIQYDNVQYQWDELDYRFGVDYPAVPESSTVGLVMGLAMLAVVAFRFFKK
jgi:hypothetical protein